MEKNLRNSKSIEIIAEIANTHQGDPNYAYELAVKSIAAGADSIKFQIYFANELLSNKHPKYTHFKKQSFSELTWINLISALRNENIKIYADIFGLNAFKLARKCNLDGFKIHSSDLNNDIILDNISDKKKVYFLSAGGSTIREIYSSIKLFNQKKIEPILMHGFQGYPTQVTDLDLSRISKLKNQFDLPVGIMEHVL